MAEEIVEIADSAADLAEGEVGTAKVQAARLAVDTRKWVLSKLVPAYSDRLQVDLAIDVKSMPDEKLNARITELMTRAGVPESVISMLLVQHVGVLDQAKFSDDRDPSEAS